MNIKPIKTLIIADNNTNKYIVGKFNEENFINKQHKGNSINQMKTPSIKDSNKVFPPERNIKNITQDKAVIINEYAYI